jgi:hypothetical protein
MKTGLGTMQAPKASLESARKLSADLSAANHGDK